MDTATMKNQVIWVASSAIFSLIGMSSAYLYEPDWTILGAVCGLVAGLGVAAFAAAGEKHD